MDLQCEGEINLCCLKVLRFGGCYCRMIFPVLTIITFHENLWLVFPLEPSLILVEPDLGTVHIVDKHVVAEC